MAKSSAILRINQEQTMQLLELYRNEECLWNRDSEDYKDHTKRNEATRRIASELDIPRFGPEHVVTKFRNLRNSYSQELNKIASCKKFANKVYKPTVYWFDIMDSFIRPHLRRVPKGTFAGLVSVMVFGNSSKGKSDMGRIRKSKEKIIKKLANAREAKRRKKYEFQRSPSIKHSKHWNEAAKNDQNDCLKYDKEKYVKYKLVGGKLKLPDSMRKKEKALRSEDKCSDVEEIDETPDPLSDENEYKNQGKAGQVQVANDADDVLMKIGVEPSINAGRPTGDPKSQIGDEQTFPLTLTIENIKTETDVEEENKLTNEESEVLPLGDHTLTSCLKEMSANIQTLVNRKEDCYDIFGKYVASLLRGLPPEKSLLVQPQIISLIAAAAQENVQIHDTETPKTETIIFTYDTEQN